LQELDRERVAQQRPELWAAVRTELVLLLQDRAAQQRPPVAVAERGRAGFLLGTFGDPRMPISLAQWRTELDALSAPQTDGYFCRIPAGDYRIGSDADDSEAYDDERPQHTVTLAQAYWVARLPITNAQWAVWVAQGGTASRYAYDDDLNQPNQPVVGIDWHVAKSYCVWLSTQLADVLPPGYVIRLPTEVEWDAAARGTETRRYPWGAAWYDDAAATEEDQATRGWQWTMPVGCYPAGATPEGLLDLAGNVWEWTLSRWQAYPGAEKLFTNEKLVVVRGGAYHNNRTYVRCGARFRLRPNLWSGYQGLRVVVSPSLAQTT
jgi:formylglycine-generating enzyme required for sulfatase activity